MHNRGVISRAKLFSFGSQNKKLIDGLRIPDFKDVWQKPETEVCRQKGAED
jgi:hypothetical protein